MHKSHDSKLVFLGWKAYKKLFLEFLCNLNPALGFVVIVNAEIVVNSVISFKQIPVRLVHTNEKTAISTLALVAFFNIITCKIIYLIHNHIPTTDIEITYTEVNSFYRILKKSFIKSTGKGMLFVPIVKD